MPYLLIDKETDKFQFFGSLPVMMSKHDLSKSKLEYHFSRKKLTYYEDVRYKIYKGNLIRGGSTRIN